MQWTFYPAFLGTFLSVVGWCYMARNEHDKANPLTLSELGAARQSTLKYFRSVLWICGPQFAITMFFFIVPRISHELLFTISWSITFLCEMLVGVFPAKGKTLLVHEAIGLTMSAGMLLMAYLFCWSLHGIFLHIEVAFALIMSGLIAFFAFNRHNRLFYELAFIFLSHFTILVAAVALK